MNLIDRSPGGLMAVAFGVLYGTILVEVAMLLDGSYAAMAATLVLIVVIAALLGRWALGLMGSDTPSLDYAPQAAPVRPAPRAAPARPRRAPAAARVPAAHR